MQFTEKALTQANKTELSEGLLSRPKSKAITIDSIYSRDLDDAVFIEKIEGKYCLQVFVADVAEIVRPDTPLDKEAFIRVETFYKANENVPMIPHILSEGKLSLLPNRPRPAICVTMAFDENGQMVPSEVADIYEVIVESTAKLSHGRVDEALLNPTHGLHEKLKLMQELAEKLYEKRRLSGALAFYDVRSHLYTDEEGIVRKYDGEFFHAQMIVQEFMIAANVAVAELLAKSGYPALYRNHKARSNVPTHDEVIRQVNEALLNPSQLPVVAEKMNLWFERARYSSSLEGHYGLNLSAYMHFTSPIRRYADVINHRIVKTLIRKQANPIAKWPAPYAKDQLDSLAFHINAWKDGVRKIRAEAFKQKTVEKRKVQGGATKSSLLNMSASLFGNVLKQAIKSDELPDDLAEATIARIADRKLLPFDFYYLLWRASDKFKGLKDLALQTIKEAPHNAIMVLEIAKSKDKIEYGFTEKAGEDGTYHSWVKVVFPDRKYLTTGKPGSGRQKKIAASIAAYRFLKWQHKKILVPVTEQDQFKIPEKKKEKKAEVKPIEGKNYVGMVMEWCQKDKLGTPEFEFESTGASHMPNFSCTAKLKNLVGAGSAATKQQAKNMACAELYRQLRG